MSTKELSRREWMRGGVAAVAAMAIPGARAEETTGAAPDETRRGAQRLSVERLKKWESLGYGMFIHFGMSTFDGKELSDGRAPATLYAPDTLDVDQWVSVARDAGMKYAVLTAKHVAGHWGTASGRAGTPATPSRAARTRRTSARSSSTRAGKRASGRASTLLSALREPDLATI